MGDTSNSKGSLHLSFLAPDVSHSGMQVDELSLNLSERPVAPFKAARFTVEPGGSSPVDRHAVHEIWYVAAGEGALVSDEHSVRLCRGDALYFEPHRSHQVKNDGTEPLEIFSMWWND